jgi:tRNA-specific 2-thiouridylase
VLGQHDGYEHFTVGQRKGLGIAFGEPRFVIRINPENRQVVLGLREDLATKSIRVHQLNWLADRPGDTFRCEVKVRYRQASESCTVQVEPDNRATIIPDEPIFGVAPGQAAVLYNGNHVLGGGWIL